MVIMNREPRIIHAGLDVRLLPGVTQVPDALWAKAKEIATVRYMLLPHDGKAAWLTEIVEGDSADVLQGLTEGAAIAVIQDTYEQPLILAGWLKPEKRPAVRAALEAALKEHAEDAAEEKGHPNPSERAVQKAAYRASGKARKADA